MTDSDRLSDEECLAVLTALFPHGLAGEDVLGDLAPEGWEKSPLLSVFHPSPRQINEEMRRQHKALAAWLPKDKQPPPPVPVPEETAPALPEIDAASELCQLMGQCLWDVFSDNHDVLTADDRTVDLGSFRGTGGFLADYLNQTTGQTRYDYMDFYLGTCWVAQRADLTPVYRLIFRRFQKQRLDWAYRFPRLHLVDFSHLREALVDKDKPEWSDYSPEKGLAKEHAAEERQRQLSEMRERLDEGHREAVEEALKQPPPATVQAYRDVYGSWPRGWPPSQDV